MLNICFLLKNFIEIFKQIGNTNITTLLVSIISMVFLYIVKIHINERFKKKMIAPIPVELIVVVVATVASYYIGLNEKYKVNIVGNLPLG